jgi:biopolymer transport protein ExbB/TolQ
MTIRARLPRWLSIMPLIRPFQNLPESIRGPIVRMSVVFGALLSLGLWQLQFVLGAMNSNIFLNASIWGTFLFGVVLTYRNLLRMKNEDLALKALKEMYEDSRNLSRGDVADPMWRHYRCNDLAVVYNRPEVLGHAYQLISEELARGREVRVSAGTMQTLVDSVQMRLDERKSLTAYIAGILILLGLIGTFIGLMETLASVGTILADLDVRGSDPTGAIALLLANLQIPLRGMAVGFSSSLFGAVGSLVLSLMVRFSAMAFSNFTQDFEEWLANIVQIDDEAAPGTAAAGVPATTLMEGRHLELVLRAARVSVSSNARLNAQLDSLSGALVELTRVTAGQTHAVQALMGGIAEMQAQSHVMSQAMARNLETTRAAAQSLDAKHEIIEATTMLGRQLQARDTALSQSLKTLDETLHVIRQREAEAAKLPTPQSNEAFRLLEQLKASLLTGELGRARDRLWNDPEDAPAIATNPNPQAAAAG